MDRPSLRVDLSLHFFLCFSRSDYPIVSQFGHVTELDQPRLGPLSNWPVAPKASLWSYLECPFLVLDACKEPSVITILVL